VVVLILKWTSCPSDETTCPIESPGHDQQSNERGERLGRLWTMRDENITFTLMGSPLDPPSGLTLACSFSLSDMMKLDRNGKLA
jgi:hypothetical protein